MTWLDYADKRYDRVRARVLNLLRHAAYSKREGETPNGWTIEGNNIIVWEQRDAFGRRGFSWDDLPSTLIDEAASGGDRTVMHKASLEQFLGRRLRTEESLVDAQKIDTPDPQGWRRSSAPKANASRSTQRI